MSAVAARKPTVVEDEPVEENKLEGFTDGLSWIKVEFRGVTYLITELPIGDYDEIVKKATHKEKIEDADTGATREVDIIDNQLQSRLMLKACIKEPDKVDINKLGTRLTIALNRAINTLHYGEELDALRPKKKDDEGSSGNP